MTPYAVMRPSTLVRRGTAWLSSLLILTLLVPTHAAGDNSVMASPKSNIRVKVKWYMNDCLPLWRDRSERRFKDLQTYASEAVHDFGKYIYDLFVSGLFVRCVANGEIVRYADDRLIHLAESSMSSAEFRAAKRLACEFLRSDVEGTKLYQLELLRHWKASRSFLLR